MVRIILYFLCQCPCISMHLMACLASHSFSDLGIVLAMLFQSSGKIVLVVKCKIVFRLRPLPLKFKVVKDICLLFRGVKSKFNTFGRPFAYCFSDLFPVSPVLLYGVNKSLVLFISPFFPEGWRDNIITAVLR